MNDWEDRLRILRCSRPDLDELPDHERVGLLLMFWPELSSFADALGELSPDQREWWLRVCAKAESQLIGGMTKFFESEDDDAEKQKQNTQ